MVMVIFITYYRRRPLIVCNKVFASALDSSVQGLWAAAPKAEWRPRRQAAIWCDRRALACGCHSAPLCSPPSVRTKQPLVSLDQPAGQWVLGHLTASWALLQFQLLVIGAKYIASLDQPGGRWVFGVFGDLGTSKTLPQFQLSVWWVIPCPVQLPTFQNTRWNLSTKASVSMYATI